LIYLSIVYLAQGKQLQALGAGGNPPSVGSGSQNQGVALAQATISAQQNTILALQSTLTAQQNPLSTQPVTPVDQTALNKTLLVGPLDGTLVHKIDGLIKTHWAGQSTENFIFNVTVQNPYSADVHPWDASIRFRRNYLDEYRLTIFSNHQWTLTKGGSTQPVDSGNIANLKTGAGESNTFNLIVQDGIAMLSVNDVHLPGMDVSAYKEPGDVGIAIGTQTGNEIEGKTTVFNDFTLWNIP